MDNKAYSALWTLASLLLTQKNEWENINSSIWVNGVYHMIDASYETEKEKQVETIEIE